MPSKTNIRFWGGLNTIGGTVVSLEYEGWRLVFDFGVIEARSSAILRQGVHVREGLAARDFLRLGRLKPIDGLYRARDVAGLSLRPAQPDGRTAVFITHLHIDHMGGLAFLSPEVPVYLSRQARALYEALHFMEDGAGWQTQVHGAKPGEAVRFGPFSVTFLEVDHDVPGACALYIAAPDLRLLYTGDLRLHGNHPEKTFAMVSAAKAMGTDVALFEGTTLRGREEDALPLAAWAELPPGALTEAAAGERIGELVARTEGLAVVNLYVRNVERIEAALAAAEQNGRTLVLEQRAACVAQKMGCPQRFCVLAGGHQTPWPDASAPVRQGWKLVDADAINARPSAFLLQNTFPNGLDLLGLALEHSLYIHAGGSPLGAYDPRYPVFRDFLASLGVEFEPVYCGGHAFPENLCYLAQQLAPRLIVPLHSLHPERFALADVPTFLPQYGLDYRFADGALVPASSDR